MKKIAISFLFTLVIILLIELFLRYKLFEVVSYSNSESIDKQIFDRNKRTDWDILFVGDSETRWGINPKIVEREFSKKGIDAKVFNHAFDGFGASWWKKIIPNFLDLSSLKNVKFLVLGIQLIDAHRNIADNGEDCGDLQKPVLTSAMAYDLNLNNICGLEKWDAKLGKKIFNLIWLVKYSSSIRSLIMPNFVTDDPNLKFNSRIKNQPINGFQSHRSISEDMDIFQSEFDRWKSQYDPEKDFKPLDQNIWPNLLSRESFFDQLKEELDRRGVTLVLYALPTNPLLIDTFKRQEDYDRNSSLLQEWANQKNLIYIDLGRMDVDNPYDYFADMRHLSYLGADDYSQKIGEVLGQRLLISNSYQNYR